MMPLTIALSKGRLAEQTIAVLERAGLDCKVAHDDSRKLILDDPEQNLRFILAKPSDVPVYVAYGAADLGVAGKDTLLETGLDLYEVLDLGVGACRLSVCGPADQQATWHRLPNKRIATTYPSVTADYFERIYHESIEIIKLNGSVEIAPLVGLSDFIVDVVESGRTLRDNGLAEYEVIAPCSARMVVNRVSMKMKAAAIEPLIQRCADVLDQLGTKA